MRSNTKAPYIDVVLHQHARREALAQPVPSSLWGVFVVLVALVFVVLWVVTP